MSGPFRFHTAAATVVFSATVMDAPSMVRVTVLGTEYS